MNITKDNIGDIICKYDNGRRIMITNVDHNLVHYQNESWGGNYCTDEHFIMGTVDLSPDAKKTFFDNQALATTLDKGEASALRNLFTGTDEEILEAEENISVIKKLKEDFHIKMNKNANERKESLLYSFLQDYNTMSVGSKAVFFKKTIEKPLNGKGIVVDDKFFNSSEMAVNELLDKKKSLSLNDMMKSASIRSGINSSDSNVFNKNNSDIQME